MSEERIRRVYRLCPCASSDVEGIQSWLEDMAGEGLFLAEDGEFCSVFMFERRQPRRTVYRLDVAQKQKPRFFSSGSGLTDEEKELYRSMGWEYLLQYGEFRIYRAAEQNATELNTESQTHAMTINLLKKDQRRSFIFGIFMVLLWMPYTGSSLRYSILSAVNMGAVFVLCVCGLLLYATLKPLLRTRQLKRYEKRLLEGDSLTHYKDWKKSAAVNYCVKAVPVLLCCGVVFGLLSALARTGTEVSVEDYPEELPFAVLADAFPEGTVVENNDWLDYGTVKSWKNAIAKNVEWNENCDITTPDGEEYFGILRLEYHETAAEWIARRLEEDFYVYDSMRYHRKRFEDIAAPDLGVDSVRVYNSYGSLYVLMREDNRVVHAVVLLDNDTNQNQWVLWAEAMAEYLK